MVKRNNLFEEDNDLITLVIKEKDKKWNLFYLSLEIIWKNNRIEI